MRMTRRSLIPQIAAVAVLGGKAVAAQEGQSPTANASDNAPEVEGITRQYIEFVSSTKFQHLPPKTVRAAKRFVLDSVGCAVAGWHTKKGRVAATVMKSAGGAPDAHIIGTDTCVSAANAAFANAELMNGLDYDAIPHTPPVTVPAILALGEKHKASGRSVLLAAVLAHEIASRLSAASSEMSESLRRTGHTPNVFDINSEAIIGAAAAGAALSAQSQLQIASAIGLAAYYCPPQTAHDWETGTPKSDVKYTPVGMICHGAVTAALLSQEGYTGNPTVLDGDASFPVFYGYRKWTPQKAVEGLGTSWRIDNVDFKPYACCRFIHSQIDCLRAVMRKQSLQAHQIESIRGSGPPFVANPDPRNVRTEEDAQFSTPFMLALVACGYTLDSSCQRRELYNDPAVHSMMQRIRWDTLAMSPEPAKYLAGRVEVVAEGRTYVESVDYPSGTASQGEELSDEELTAKCEANLKTRLSAAKASQAVRALWDIESAQDIGAVMQLLSA